MGAGGSEGSARRAVEKCSVVGATDQEGSGISCSGISWSRQVPGGVAHVVHRAGNATPPGVCRLRADA